MKQSKKLLQAEVNTLKSALAAKEAEAETLLRKWIESDEDGTVEAVETVEHETFTLVVTYKHSKYATEDSNNFESFVEEIVADKYRHVTDHFAVTGIDFKE